MAILALEHVSKSFGGVHAVSKCSFVVEEHSVTALVGPNGAGKTTVFNIVNGFIRQDSGKVFFLGQDVSHLNVWKRSRAGMSRTFQLSRMFRNLTIRENLLLAIREDDDLFWRNVLGSAQDKPFEARIREMLDFVGLEKGLDAKVTDLSYGQQKLFDLARALLNPHQLLLLDEPVAGVNPVVREKLAEVLKELKKRQETILLIEHDIDFVRKVSDSVIVMDQGGVLASGLPEEVLNNKDVLEAYLGPAFK